MPPVPAIEAAIYVRHVCIMKSYFKTRKKNRWKLIKVFLHEFPSIIIITEWPKKVSHYRESSLNRTKNRQPG